MSKVFTSCYINKCANSSFVAYYSNGNFPAWANTSTKTKLAVLHKIGIVKYNPILIGLPYPKFLIPGS